VNRISIRPVWTLHHRDQRSLPTRLPPLLVQVQARGSLLAACRELDLSYRHAWDLVRQGEEYFGAPLLVMVRGKGSTLTVLGEKLVWADHRINARLAPILDSLASELAAEINRTVKGAPPVMRLHASHGFAVEKLVAALGDSGIDLDHRYASSVEAASALHDHACDVAGLHIPEGVVQESALLHYAAWIGEGDLQVVDVATRRQGLVVAPGNPMGIYDIGDLARPGVRFINRQTGSGTRFLVECLLRLNGVNPQLIPGFEHGEFTHAAVAAFVASGMADVGVAIETPARRFGLEFLPLATERYVLLCTPETLETAPMRAVVALLRSPEFRSSVNELQGYDATQAGRILPLADAFTPVEAVPPLAAPS
jgi:molybdate transport repressor ModE-like protein